jgi:hypothetical protein
MHYKDLTTGVATYLCYFSSYCNGSGSGLILKNFELVNNATRFQWGFLSFLIKVLNSI